jgi:hypothetical protein
VVGLRRVRIARLKRVTEVVPGGCRASFLARKRVVEKLSRFAIEVGCSSNSMTHTGFPGHLDHSMSLVSTNGTIGQY